MSTPGQLSPEPTAATMHTTNLRKVGGSIMLAVPRALLDILHLQPGAQVGIVIESGRIVIEPRQRRRYPWTSC